MVGSIKRKERIMTKRIEYIDALRGFNMILIVMLHVFICSYHANTETFNWHSYFSLFNLPLFFFISGFVFYRKDRLWNIHFFLKFIMEKTRILLLPTLVFFSSYSYIFGLNFVKEICTDLKSGYWFTIVLFCFFTIYAIIMTVFRVTKLVMIILLILSILLLWSNKPVIYDLVNPNLISIGKLRYFIFFLLGVFVKNHFNNFERLLVNRWTMTFLIPFFFISVILLFHSFMPETLKFVLWGSSGLIIVFGLFRHYEKSFAKESIIGYCLQYIGTRTLDVYLLHYFFLPQNLHEAGQFFNESLNPTIELFVTLLLALLIICLCLILSNVIRLSPLLAHWLFGAKSTK